MPKALMGGVVMSYRTSVVMLQQLKKNAVTGKLRSIENETAMALLDKSCCACTTHPPAPLNVRFSSDLIL